MKPYKMEYSEGADSADIYIFGDIEKYEWIESDVTSWSFKEDFQKITADTINVHINSYGGVVSEGLAIFNIIKNSKAKTVAKIDGFACSIASVIAMACDEIHMPETSLMMIHKPTTYSSGNADDFRAEAERLDKILEPSISAYLSKANISREELLELLKEDTWLTASQCYEMGFCTTLIKAKDTQSLGSVYKLVLENDRLKKEILQLNSKTTTQILNEFFS